MLFGRGMLHCWSGKQNINIKSSTEAEIVGISNYLPYNIHLVIFLYHQGYPILNNISFQDNQTSIDMEMNGGNSFTVNSRNIAIKYFFTKDRIEKRKIVIKYCPTELMIAGFFTKYLQERAFKIFRYIIMGYTNISKILQTLNDNNVSFPIKEPVENYDMSKTGGNDWKQSVDKRGINSIKYLKNDVEGSCRNWYQGTS